MNTKTIHKLALELLNDNDDNKENEVNNILMDNNIYMQYENKKNMSKEQIISMKRMNAKKIQEINIEKQKEIQNMKESYEREKKQLIEKYEKIVMEKEEYIKILQELFAGKSTQLPKKQSIQQQKPTVVKFSKGTNKVLEPPQILYMHQVPLYQQLCYSIERPLFQINPQVSEFCATQKLKSRANSNQKGGYLNCENSMSNSKYRSTSTARQRSNSRHGLAPACPPKFSKIL